MNKHTPGPWEVRKPILRGKYRGDFAVGPKSHEGYNQDPVFCHLAKGRDDIQAANAALIAAAPELLEDGRELLAMLGQWAPNLLKSAEALAFASTLDKAEGR